MGIVEMHIFAGSEWSAVQIGKWGPILAKRGQGWKKHQKEYNFTVAILYSLPSDIPVSLPNKPAKQYFYWMNVIVTKYIHYILKKESHVIPPSNKLCVDLTPEPNIESTL